MVLLFLLMAAPRGVYAQTELITEVADTVLTDALPPDSTAVDDWLDEEAALKADFDLLESLAPSEYDDIMALPDDSLLLTRDNLLTESEMKQLQPTAPNIFIPDPQRALWLSFVIPGGGQIYNRKYWKLPIFYGGFLGCMYAFRWNQQMYMDYSQAYLDIMDDNPNTNSYLDMFPPSYDIDSNVSRFQTIFKNRKDRFRRWRDLSTFCFIGVYALSIIDAYVDAHLSVFDISPDLSLQWGPTSVEGPYRNVGLGATLNF